MKGTQTNCSNCGQPFTKKRDNHTYCQNSCRTSAYRKRNNISPPVFLQGVELHRPTPPASPPLSTKQQVMNLNWAKTGLPVKPNELQIRTADYEINKLYQDRNYWLRVIEDAEKGVFPIATLGLAGLASSASDNAFERLLLGIAGAWVGNEIDKGRKAKKKNNAPAIIADAEEQIRLIDKEIRSLKNLNKAVKNIKNDGYLIESGSGKMQISDIISGKEYRSKNIPSLGISPRWKYLIGDPAPGFSMLLSGSPGNGKSTTAIEFAQDFQNQFGKVLFIAAEQSGLNKPLQMLLERFKATFDIWNKPNSDIEVISSKIAPYKLVVIDSVSNMKLSPDDIETLRKENPAASFLLVMQCNKDGHFRGSQEFLHNADIHVQMQNFTAKQTKSRFAPPSEMLMGSE